MSKLPTKFVIAILAAGILIGATTMSTVAVPLTKSSNLATAQLRFPFQSQPRVQVPSQQQPPSAGPNSPSADPPGGPNCSGCITTENLANGAVTNPKLGPLSVSTANIGDSQVTSQKIAPGAVSISVISRSGTSVSVPPGDFASAFASCQPGEVPTGGGAQVNGGLNPPPYVFNSIGTIRDWQVNAFNPSATTWSLHATVQCMTIHP